jgi:tetratricopeptide (TPR) repeat protein
MAEPETTLLKAPVRPRRRRFRPRVRALVLLATIVAITGLGLGIVVWWEERPLAQIAYALQRREFRDALTSADRFLADHPHDLRAGIYKARALSGLNRHRDADTVFQQVALTARRFPDDADALRAWSTSLLYLEQWDRAIALLETLLETHPSDADALFSVTAARIRARRYEAALESAARLEALPGSADRANVMIGAIHHDRGNRREALAAWEKVLAGNPDAKDLQISSDRFLLMAGDEALFLGMPRRAAAILERSVAQRPSADACTALGKAYAQSGQLKRGIGCWRQALELDSLHPGARQELANSALLAGEPQQTIDWLLPLTDRNGLLDSSGAYLLQRAYARLNQPEEMQRWRERADALRDRENVKGTLSELLQRTSDPFWTSFLLAYQSADDGKWDEAERVMEQLSAQRPKEALVQELAAAVRERGTLPPISRLTGRQFQ